MRRFFCLILLSAVLAVPAHAAGLTNADRDFLVHAVASSYPDAGFGGRVGICSVILRRMDDDRFPDTAASVTASFGGGCFTDAHTPDEKTLRLTSDALDLALMGADPTGGALYFTVLDDGSPVYDFRFDNSGEKQRLYTVEEFLRGHPAQSPVCIDGIGFHK